MNLSHGYRVAVVGAAGTIGHAICRAFAEAGASVIAGDLAGASESASPPTGATRMTYATVDVTDLAAVDRFMQICWQKGPIDGVVYAAGVNFTADVAETDWSKYQDLMRVNLDGAFHIAQAFVRPMIAGNRSGTFTFVSSTAGKRGEAGAAAYCASKFGLIGFVQSFAAEVARHGIRVNAVCPGNVDSPMLWSVARAHSVREGRSAETIMEEYARQSAASRLVRPDEVAAVCLWLSTDGASAVIGEAINVDAGALSG